jgi:hypothetical protein
MTKKNLLMIPRLQLRDLDEGTPSTSRRLSWRAVLGGDGVSEPGDKLTMLFMVGSSVVSKTERGRAKKRWRRCRGSSARVCTL